MGLFSRRQQHQESPPPSSPPAPPAPVSLEKALTIFAVDAVEKQTQFAQAQFQQIKEMAELNAEMARDVVRRSGKRLGGKVRAKTAKRDSRGRMRADCRLCENPAIVDPTADEIIKHATHSQRPAERIPVKIETDPRTGDEVIECENCGTPHPEGQHLN